MGHIGRISAEIDTALQSVRQDGEPQTLLLSLLDTRVSPTLSLGRKYQATSKDGFTIAADGSIVKCAGLFA